MRARLVNGNRCCFTPQSLPSPQDKKYLESLSKQDVELGWTW